MGSYSFRKTLLFVSLLTPLSVLTAYANKVHRVTQGDTLEKVESQYKELDSLNPQYPSKKVIRQKFEPKKEFVVDSGLKLVTCTHTIQRGEWLASVIRRYSYRRPFSLGLIEKLRELNQSLENIDNVEIGEEILIPLFVSKNKNVRSGSSCQALVGSNGLDVLSIGSRSQRGLASEGAGLNHKIDGSMSGDGEKINSIYFAAGPVYNTILVQEKSSDLDGTLISEAYPALTVALSRQFSEHWSFGARYERLQNAYRVETSDSAAIKNKEIATNGFFLSAQKVLDHDMKIGFGLGLLDSVFYKRLSSSMVEVGSDQILKLHVKVRRELLSLKGFDFSGSLGLHYLLPFQDSSFGFERGRGYHLGLGLERQLGHGRLVSSLTYSRQFSKSRDLELEKSWVRALVGYQFLF